MKPKTEMAKREIERAFRAFSLSEKQAYDLAFHLTDWIDDLRPFVGLLENPTKHSVNQIQEIIIRFLVHAPDHLRTAAELVLDSAERDDTRRPEL